MTRSKAVVEVDYEPIGDAGMNITHFFVPPEYRRRGIGSTVLSALLTRWTADGLEYVVVNIRGGESARQFLTELGFDIVEGPHPDGFLTAELELITGFQFPIVSQIQTKLLEDCGAAGRSQKENEQLEGKLIWI